MSSDTPFTMPADAHLGRVALRVSAIDRLLPFYRDVVGLDVEQTGGEAVLSAGGTPLVVLHEDPGAPARPDDAAGLFHLAVRVPDRAALGDALARIEESSAPAASLTGASDHLVSEALYLRDPDGNGVEIYCDRPREEWTFTDDRVEMATLRLDLDGLRDTATGATQVPDGTDLGHVHLEVTALDESRAFYVDTLGLNVRTESYQGALFVAAGEYHHHVGLNTWNHRRAAVGDHRGVEWFEFVVPTQRTLEELDESRAGDSHDGTVGRVDGTLRLADPNGVGVRLRAEE